MSLKNAWVKKYITDVDQIVKTIEAEQPLIIVMDTETTGLHLIKDVPFILTFTYKANGIAWALGYEIDKHSKEETTRLIKALYKTTAQYGGFLIGHNLPFDLSMAENINCPIDRENNLMDTMTLIRLGTDAVQVKRGGAPIGLKDFAARYIDRSAKDTEKAVSAARESIAKHYNTLLYAAIGRGNIGKFRDFLKTIPNDADDLPEEQRITYTEWLKSLPPEVTRTMTGNFVTKKNIPYSFVPRETIKEYALYDVIYTYEIYEMLYPIVQARMQNETLKMENNAIGPLVRLLRTGFKMNVTYIKQARLDLKAYIRVRAADLIRLAGTDITCNQNEKLLNILQVDYEDLTSVGKDALDNLLDDLDEEEETTYDTNSLVSTVKELRTLTKWYKTYLMKFYRAMQYDDMIYTGLNPAGTVTGRFTSDFQQFPKKAIKNDKKEEIFNPRSMIIVTSDEYVLFYLDYSQVELRIQAFYTILIGSPDLNLCRAYLPYKCHHYRTGAPYDYTRAEHTKHWDRKQPNSSDSVWLLDEDNSPWIPTDIHAKTTHNCFEDLDMHSEEFKKLRSVVGKRLNFACNYGARAKKIQEMFHGITFKEASKRYQAYRDAYPGVVKYHQWCYDVIAVQGYGSNLYGRRYYNTLGHNFANAAIQGTGADILKLKLIEMDQYLRTNRCKTRIQMNIHDEFCILLHRSEFYLIPLLKQIMEDIPDTYVPIVAEAEISETTWANKKGFVIENGNIRYCD